MIVIMDGRDGVRCSGKSQDLSDSKDSVGFFRRFCDFIINHDSSGTLRDRIKLPARIALAVFILFFGLGGMWSILAPLEGAVIAMGNVVLFSKNQIIQHLEGGVIEEIYVKEGDSILKDQPLIQLKDVEREAQLAILSERIIALKATRNRLVSEQNDEITIVFDDFSDLQISEARKNNILDSQRVLFNSRRLLMVGQMEILQNKVEQSHNEIKGLEYQVEAVIIQDQLTVEELDSKKKLLEGGGISRPQLIILEKQHAVLIGKKGEYEAAIAQVKQRISEAQLEGMNVKNKFYNEVVGELKSINVEIVDIEERIRSLHDVLSRMTVRSPQDGVVNSLKYHTVGGVIAPGSFITEIVPVGDKMVVDAMVAPSDVESVLAAQQDPEYLVDYGDGVNGVKVKIRMIAHNSRTVGTVEGVLEYISADLIVDDKTKVGAYVARVFIPESSLKDINNEGINLYPGMPVMVYIVTQSRTFFSYLFTPLTYSLMNAFRER